MRIIENENENWEYNMNWIKKNRNDENWNEIKIEKKWEKKSRYDYENYKIENERRMKKWNEWMNEWMNEKCIMKW